MYIDLYVSVITKGLHGVATTLHCVFLTQAFVDQEIQ